MSGEQSSSWCTNWSAYNTPRLWAMVAGEGNPEAWRQADAWSAITVDLQSQLERLRKAQDLLGSAWPSDQSEASNAFTEDLRNLIGRMDLAKNDAESTASALSNILYALQRAKDEIEPLWQQYKSKNDDIVPAWWDKAEEEIDTKARAYIATADRAVEQNVLGIRVPDPYEFRALDNREGGNELPPTGSGGQPGAGNSNMSPAASAMPPHNPPPPMPGHIPVSGTPSGAVDDTDPFSPSDSSFFRPDHDPPPAVASPSPHDSSTVRPPRGPELSEIVPPPSQVHTPLPVPPPAVQPGVSLPPGTFVPGSVLMPVAGGGGVARPIGSVPSGASRPPSGRTPTVMPSGAVIGQTPIDAYGRMRDEGAAKGARPSVRPSPPSWLPGSAGQSSGVANSVMPANSRKNGEADEGGGQRFDPDNPWAVSHGVASVIEPTRDVPVSDSGLWSIGQKR